MSWEPVQRWALRCDGRVTHDRQCEVMFLAYSEDEETLQSALWTDVERLDFEQMARWLVNAGWQPVRDGRVLCPRHVDAGARLVEAVMDGLPFEDDEAVTES